MNNLRDTSGELRSVLDGSDPFMTGGHQIVKIRTIARAVPNWAKSKELIQGVLLISFPKLRTDQRQRTRAARWAAVIHLYFVMGLTYSQAAHELNMKPRTIECVIRAIKRATSGFQANGMPRSTRPRGRPKNSAVAQTSLGSGQEQGPNEALTSTSLHRTDQGSRGDSRASSAQEVSLQEESHR